MKTNLDNVLSQWERRVIAFKFIYSLLIDETLTKEDMEKKLQKEIDNENKYIVKIISCFIQNKEEFEQSVSLNLLKTWTLSRVNYIDKAIIFSSMSEYKAHNIDRNIIIDQAIITSKKYGDDGSYKFINFILDKVLMKK